jgi:hypothetical protein
VKDQLLALIVVAGALFVCWIVLRDQRRKDPRRGSGYDGSSGDAGSESGDHGWFGGHGHSGDHGGGDAGGSDGAAMVAAVMEVVVTAAGVVAIEARPPVVRFDQPL